MLSKTKKVAAMSNDFCKEYLPLQQIIDLYGIYLFLGFKFISDNSLDFDGMYYLRTLLG